MADVLVVDDAIDLVQVLMLLFEARGYSAHGCEDGRGAVDGVLAHRPLIVLMDVEMPFVGGLWALRQIRALGILQPQVMAHTSIERAAIAEHLRPGGFDGYIQKPCNANVLLAHVERVVRAARHPGG